MRYLLILSLLFFSPLLAQADTYQPTGTRINVSATTETELPNDEVVINFRVEKEGMDANIIREEVNRITALIEKRLHKEKGVKVKTTSRNMQPVWHYPKNKPRVRTSWRIVQASQITSSKLDDVPSWLDAIEKAGAHLSGLNFRINSQTAMKVKETLRLQAIQTFRVKATIMAMGLDAKTFRIISLNSNSQAPQPRMYRAEMAMMSRSMDAGSAAPALSSGEGRISVTVHGEIEVPFTDFPVK